jgi:hypothetical protein
MAASMAREGGSVVRVLAFMLRVIAFMKTYI